MSDVPGVDEVLRLGLDGLTPLDQPVLVVALEGWFDMGGAATAALESLFPEQDRLTIGEIDPDPFYDFTVERPMVEMADGVLRRIRWPRNTVDLWRPSAGGEGRDVVLLLGVEPHVAWRSYCDAVTAVVERTGSSVVVRSEERRVGKECRSRWSPYH